MRIYNLIRLLPFFSTFLLIIILGISNQKENAKLKILIWNTPSLTLGSYLAISTTSGFILAYVITTSLSKLNKYQDKQQLIPNDNNQYTETNEDINKPFMQTYDNTLIERDIKDPLPTVTANFRIISRKGELYNEGVRSNIQDGQSIESEIDNNEQCVEEETMNKVKSNTSDWNDQSFSDW